MLDSDGSLAGVMGISIVYISQGNITTTGTTTKPATSAARNAASEMIGFRGVLLAALGVALLLM